MFNWDSGNSKRIQIIYFKILLYSLKQILLRKTFALQSFCLYNDFFFCIVCITGLAIQAKFSPFFILKLSNSKIKSRVKACV